MVCSADQAGEVRYGVDEQPRFWPSVLIVVQYLEVMLGRLLLPFALATAAGLTAAETGGLVSLSLLAMAVTTLFASWRRTGTGYWATTGSSISFHAASLHAVGVGGMPLFAGMTIVGGVLRAVMSPLIRRFKHVFTPALAGYVMITLAIWLRRCRCVHRGDHPARASAGSSA